MGHLATIYDGSEHELGEEYPLCNAVAADVEQKKVILLYFEAYSHEAPGFISDNDQLGKLIDLLFRHLGSRGIHAIDRGGDRGFIYRKYPDKGEPTRFVIRLKS